MIRRFIEGIREIIISYGWVIIAIFLIVYMLLAFNILSSTSNNNSTTQNCQTNAEYFFNTTCEQLNLTDNCNNYVEIVDNSTMVRILTKECT